MRTLTVTELGGFEDKDTYGVGFAGSCEGEDTHVILSRSARDTELDIALGMNSVHIEIGDQSNSNYGAVSDLVVAEDLVRVSIDASHIGLDPGYDDLNLHCVRVRDDLLSARPLLARLAAEIQEGRRP